MTKMTVEQLYEQYQRLKSLCVKLHLNEYVDKCNFKMEELKEPLRFMIAGESKSGKSTLLNALVGQEVAAVAYDPKTWCINVYYGDEKNPYGELVYRDEKKKITIEEAKKVSDKIENIEYKSLLEIRWHLPLAWPTKNILLIDTPGFGQVRKNTNVESVRIDMAEGIKYKGQDGFESYQYKADLVLWCITPGSIGDTVIEEKLKNSPFDRDRIYGILTMMDSLKDENAEERCYQKCVATYQKYVKTFIKSKLPRVREKDPEEVAKKKERMRRESVNSVRYIIDYLLKDNAFESVKIDSSYAYFKVLQKQVGDIVSGYLLFYHENQKVMEKLLSQINSDFNELLDTGSHALTDWIREQKNELSDSTLILKLWKDSCQNVQVFEELFNAQIRNRYIEEQLEGHLENYRASVRKTVQYFQQSVKFKQLEVGKKDYSICEQSTPMECSLENMAGLNATFKMESLGLSYSLLNFAKSLGLGELANALLGQFLAQKLTAKTQETVQKIFDDYEKKTVSYIKGLGQNAEKKLVDHALWLFGKFTGVAYGEVENEMLLLERQCSQIGFTREGTKIYPYLENEKVYFFASAYYPQTRVYAKENKKKIAQLYFHDRIEPLLSKSQEQMMEKMDRLLADYNGTPLSMPDFGEKGTSLFDDMRLHSVIPELKNIEWGAAWGELQKQYVNLCAFYKEQSKKYWMQKYQDKKERYIRQWQNQIQMEMNKEIDLFVAQWEKAVDWMIDQTNRNGYKYIFPNEMNWNYYYQYDYCIYHNNDLWIPKLIQKQYTKEVETVLRIGEKRLEKIAQRENQRWDEAIQPVYVQFVRQYDMMYEELDKQLRLQVPLWEKYKEASKEMNPKNRIADFLDFVKKSRRLSTEYINLLELKPKLMQMGFYGTWIYSDGRTVYDKVKDHVETKAKDVQRKWGNIE